MEVINELQIVIHGITESGNVFRPNDWAERIAGQLSRTKNHRLVYSPLLRPCMKQNHKCVILSPALKRVNPAHYRSILKFARLHGLKITVGC